MIQPHVSHCRHGGKKGIFSQESRHYVAIIMPFIRLSLYSQKYALWFSQMIVKFLFQWHVIFHFRMAKKKYLLSGYSHLYSTYHAMREVHPLVTKVRHFLSQMIVNIFFSRMFRLIFPWWLFMLYFRQKVSPPWPRLFRPWSMHDAPSRTHPHEDKAWQHETC